MTVLIKSLKTVTLINMIEAGKLDALEYTAIMDEIKSRVYDRNDLTAFHFLVGCNLGSISA